MNTVMCLIRLRQLAVVSQHSLSPMCYMLRNSVVSNFHHAKYCSAVKNKSEKKPVIYVLLLDAAGKVIGTKTKEEAMQLAKKHNMSLVALEDDGSKKKAKYQLKPGKDIALEFIKAKEKTHNIQKDVKNVAVTAAISDHDLSTKVKQIEKWLQKDCEVRVGVTGKDSDERLDSIFKKFESSIGENGRLLQKRIKNGVLRFVIQQPKNKGSEAETAAGKTKLSKSNNNKTSSENEEHSRKDPQETVG